MGKELNIKKDHCIQKTGSEVGTVRTSIARAKMAAYSGLEKSTSKLEGWDFNSSAKPVGVKALHFCNTEI